MAKLADTIKLKHIPSSLEGVYARNMPQALLREKMAKLQTISNEKNIGIENMTLFIFKEFVCDEEGEIFEDCLTLDGIENCMDMRTTMTIITEIPNLYVPKDDNLGNSKGIVEDS